MSCRPGAATRQNKNRASSSSVPHGDDDGRRRPPLARRCCETPPRAAATVVSFCHATTPSIETAASPACIRGTPTRATVPAGTWIECLPARTSKRASALRPKGVGTAPSTDVSVLVSPKKYRGTASHVRQPTEVGRTPSTDSVSHAVMPDDHARHSDVRMSLMPPSGGAPASPARSSGSQSGSKRSQKHVAPPATLPPHVARASASAASVAPSASRPRSW
mmetsp:Transcript_4005/g.16009  ORF Transcript_4005/g.16009 Transcript_4005/m.16009 type:complete len:220 (+) Transcript_4005:2394-3053(+)